MVPFTIKVYIAGKIAKRAFSLWKIANKSNNGLYFNLHFFSSKLKTYCLRNFLKAIKQPKRLIVVLIR